MSIQVRGAFAQNMNSMQMDILRMGSFTEKMLQLSIKGLVNRNAALCEDVIKMDDIADGYNIRIEAKALELLALQQPVAKDLRVIVSAIRIIADIERIGDYTVDIAKTARTMSLTPVFKPLVDIPKIADIVTGMLQTTLEGFVQKDIAAIEKMIKDDDMVDHLYKSLHNELITYMESDPRLIRQCVYLIQIARFLERIADHITNIGERVYYMETGEIKELHI